MQSLKKAIIVTTLFAGFSFLCPTPSHAEDQAQAKKWTVDTVAAFNSDYMFRGLNLYHGLSIQPSVTGSYISGDYGTFGGTAWFNFSVDESNRSEAFGEIDYTLTYDVNLSDFATMTLGHIWYTFYDDNSKRFEDTQEYFVSLTANAFLSPTFSFYSDYDELEQQYFELSFSHKLEIPSLGEGFNMTPYAAVGFVQDGEILYDDPEGVTHVAFGTTFDLTLGSVAVTPGLNYSYAIDDNAENHFWTGITFSKSF